MISAGLLLFRTAHSQAQSLSGAVYEQEGSGRKSPLTGVNVFWIDLTLNGLDYLHNKFGGKVCFQGLTDVQFVLCEGTSQKVAQHGKDLIAALGDFDGGFIACSELAPDQPLENIISILDTFENYSAYPLKVKWDKQNCCAIDTN